MKINFLKINDPLLKGISSEITRNNIYSPETKRIIKVMLNTATGEQKNKNESIMVGLAAPQIGIFKRIILVDLKADGKGNIGNMRIYIDPKIVWQSKKKGEWYEGCFSTGKICGIVSRPTSIKIQGFMLKFGKDKVEFVEEKWTGYVARIFQHEIDHLDGNLFISHIKDPNKLHLVERREFPLYRDKEAWRHWPKKASLPLA